MLAEYDRLSFVVCVSTKMETTAVLSIRRSISRAAFGIMGAFWAVLVLIVVFSTSSSNLNFVSATGSGTNNHHRNHNETATTFPEFNNVNEANRKEASQQMAKKIQDLKHTALQMLRAGRTENCDWVKHQIAYLKGDMCGSHYKVLGLDRSQYYDKADIKKAYRQRSLNVHPDKNPSEEALSAFEVLQKAYECLSDDACSAEYNYNLNALEAEAAAKRLALQKSVQGAMEGAVMTGHYYTVRAADYVTSKSSEIWDYIGNWEIELFGGYHKLGQYVTLGLLLFSPARLLLQIQAVAYGIVQFNNEIMRAASRR
jgi:hypothetical protein